MEAHDFSNQQEGNSHAKNPGDGSRRQTDYIMISKRFKIAPLSAKTYPRADSYSDHVSVTLKFKMKVKETQGTQRTSDLT